MIQANFEKNFDSWRIEARRLLTNGIAPSDINWDQEELSFFTEIAQDKSPPTQAPARLTVPADFIDLARDVSCAREEGRWSLLYRILYRLQHETPHLLEVSVDHDIHRAQLLRKSVRRDIHKMHAFVRFKKTMVLNQEVYTAWHKPEHLIVQAATPFFARRFGDRRWSIFTPDESAHWDLEALSFGPGLSQNEFQVKDDWDEVWKTYYKSIFNPARIKMKAMKLEMAPKYWSSLPEASIIRDLVRDAPQRLQNMSASHNRAAELQSFHSFDELKKSALACKSCPLYENATQTVFGKGAQDTKIMIIGEQPGDQEDLAGEPFVGPAGKLLMAALKESELEVGKLYLTNAVKHFKWKRSGKVRLHQKPSGREMHACKPWLEAEIQLVKPKVIIALGATAATAVLGRLPKISAERGVVRTDLKIAPAVLISWHPSAILRAPLDEAEEMRRQLIEDLQRARELC